MDLPEERRREVSGNAGQARVLRCDATRPIQWRINPLHSTPTEVCFSKHTAEKWRRMQITGQNVYNSPIRKQNPNPTSRKRQEMRSDWPRAGAPGQLSPGSALRPAWAVLGDMGRRAALNRHLGAAGTAETQTTDDTECWRRGAPGTPHADIRRPMPWDGTAVFVRGGDSAW